MATLVSFIAFLIAGGLAYLSSDLVNLAVASWLGMALPAWIAPGIVGFILFSILGTIGTGLAAVMALTGGGLVTFAPMRWLKAKLTFLLLLVAAIWLVTIGLHSIGAGWESFLEIVMHPLLAFWPPYVVALLPAEHQTFMFVFAVIVMRWIWFSFIFGAIIALVDLERKPLAYATLPLRRLWRALKSGVGGSSSFIGLFDEWLMPWKPGQILLGTSTYEPGRKLGRNDDRHMLTVATSRSGKGRSSIIPNLLTWPGSAIIIDPKGQNAAITARKRRLNLGQTVLIVDPFGVLENFELGEDWWRTLKTERGTKTARYNPLADIDLNDVDVVEQIRNLGAALVMPSPHANPFWDNAARMILSGVIAHVLVSPTVKDDDRHMGTVRDFIAHINGRDLLDLAKPLPPGTKTLGNLAIIAASELARASASAGSDIMLTLGVHTEWLDSVAIRENLTASDFSLAKMKDKATSLYLVIPPQYIETHARYLRMFITMALREAGQGSKPAHAMLFLLDEFTALGELKVVAEAAAQLAGSGVKLWPIVQNLTQLKQHYGDNWEVFSANAGQVQVFAMNDQFTARYYSERLGHHISWRKVQSAGGTEWVPQGATWLRTAVELARESSKDSGQALVFFEGGETALMKRASYDSIFKPMDYDPDPYEKPTTVQNLRRKFTGESVEDMMLTALENSALGRKMDAWDDAARARRLAKQAAKARQNTPAE